MLSGVKDRLGRLGRLEWAFLAGLILYFVLPYLPNTLFPRLLTGLAVSILGFVLAIRLGRVLIRRTVWRLRNRLIIAYLFIALVPILLIVLMGGLTTYWITGQVAGYLVNAELNRRAAGLVGPARRLARTPPERREAMATSMLAFTATVFPDLDIVVRDAAGEHIFPPDANLTIPPAGWDEARGVLLRKRRVYIWLHEKTPDVEVVMASPLSHEFLSNLVPELGSVSLVNGILERLDESFGPKRDRIPPPYNLFDIVVTGSYPIPMQIWEDPGATEDGILLVQTRTSAVLGLLFGHNVFLEKMEWGQLILVAFLVLSGLFLVVEVISLWIGISITRSVTGAVHELYEGTRRVMEGDFSHRIPVRGDDQLASLGVSFNTMTANLERLIVVAKEKERLQSELEIAREVQNQLFPKKMPDLRTLRIAGACNPARMVSGDYYDFMRLYDSTLAFAIGDVAGKGISAALLMAAIQSTMHTQFTTGISAATTAGGGAARAHLSTARLVSVLNKQLYASTSPEKYATFFLALYDDDTNTLTYTNAGHLPPILLSRGTPAQLDVNGTVVGAFRFSEYEESRVQLQPGDLLVGYTDGIVEPENVYGEMYGERRLTDLLVKHAGCDSDEIIAKAMEAVQQWTGGGELQDDMTMLVARRI
ncbi:MAG: SpoIIE family protein phosphatase [Acidobacteria bacterium]|nr:SpoIIE family protein phosphatase [Acidobacteriota bacterium]